MFEAKKVGPLKEAPTTVLAVFTYGGLHRTSALCILRDAVKSTRDCMSGAPWPMTVDFPTQDALIDRSRSVAAKRFLEGSDSEVLVMVDHDIEWCGENPDNNYEGDLLHIARLAHEHQAIVGAAVSKRVKGQGWASMIWDDGVPPHSGDISMGSPGLVRFHYVGAAFTAYPRAAIQAVSDSMDDIPPGFKPIFLPMVVEHPLDSTKKLHLSEDWALCHRAGEMGFKTFTATMPVTKHWGDYPYQILGDAIPEEHIRNVRPIEERGDVYTERTKISCLHATRGRPEMASDAYRTWMDRATYPERIEYIFSYDEDDTSVPAHELLDRSSNDFKHCRYDNPGNVSAYNAAAYHSTGEILVQVHDDVVPPRGWDEELEKRLDVGKEQVLHVDDGLLPTVNNKPWLMTVAMGTRKWFRSCGYFFHPGYTSLYCDDDFSLAAAQHCEIVMAKDLRFEHYWGGQDKDETSTRSYSQKNWQEGKRLLTSRCVNDFPLDPDEWQDLGEL